MDLRNERAVLPENETGYKLNLRNVAIIKLYDRYKVKNKIPPFVWMPPDKRREFEHTIIMHYSGIYERIFGERYQWPGDDIQRARMSEIIERAVNKDG